MVLIGEIEFREDNCYQGVSVPLRGLWFLSQCWQLTRNVLRCVSVPLRGLWFLSVATIEEDTGFPNQRFRPLAGIMVLIEKPSQSKGGEALWKFPSPCGDYGSYRRYVCSLCVFNFVVSVPLRGLWFLSALVYLICYTLAGPVSVPLRGLWFLSRLLQLPAKRNWQVCFRPLAGIMVLIV